MDEKETKEMDMELFNTLEALEEEPLTGGTKVGGKVDWDAVRDHFLTVEGAKPNYFTIKDMETYIKEDLGEEISYSSCHSWLRRLDKKETFHVIKKINDGTAYYKIVKKTKSSKPEESDV